MIYLLKSFKLVQRNRQGKHPMILISYKQTNETKTPICVGVFILPQKEAHPRNIPMREHRRNSD